MSPRQTYSLEEIKDMLLARRDQVVARYAPSAPGSYTDKGAYFTLNPGRADRSVGSFVIWLDGPKAGRWCDFAMSGKEAHGDLLDLICLNLGCDLKDGLREARAFLGLEHLSPEDLARQKQAAERARRLRMDARAKEAEAREKKRGMAMRLWLEAKVEIRGTPVALYLSGERGIDLDALPRTPHAIRFHPQCYYKHIDRETGEVIEGRWPAMVTLIAGPDGKALACHRTYLEFYDGRWRKARVPEAKKVLGDYKGGAIRLWRGLGPRGGAGRRLSELEPGAHVWIAEGIEDALSCALVLPEATVLSAISLSNMGGLWLPETVAEVTLVADQDEGEQAKAALHAAIAAHAAQGRTVRLWQNADGGKDLNDALRARLQEQKKGAA
jgi:hypothetical protein